MSSTLRPKSPPSGDWDEMFSWASNVRLSSEASSSVVPSTWAGGVRKLLSPGRVTVSVALTLLMVTLPNDRLTSCEAVSESVLVTSGSNIAVAMNCDSAELLMTRMTPGCVTNTSSRPVAAGCDSDAAALASPSSNSVYLAGSLGSSTSAICSPRSSSSVRLAVTSRISMVTRVKGRCTVPVRCPVTLMSPSSLKARFIALTVMLVKRLTFGSPGSADTSETSAMAELSHEGAGRPGPGSTRSPRVLIWVDTPAR
mmetsp:Transcript_7744/g.30589  ORF Transcript_7744/g.30589 Transcript_7744/m.30589 type:complete len:255 (-) Transcript_7744:300-1064(-)